MKSNLSIAIIVGIVVVAVLLTGGNSITGAAISYPTLTGESLYCRQTVDPFTGVGSFMCDSPTQRISISEGSLRKPGQIPLFYRAGGSTIMIYNPQRRCSSVACDLAFPKLIYTKLPYSRAPYYVGSYGTFSRERWCARDPDRCFNSAQSAGSTFVQEKQVKFVYLQGSPYNWRRTY